MFDQPGIRQPGIRRGHSVLPDATDAVRELHAQIAQPRMGLVIFFCSPSYDLDALAAAVARAFDGVTVIGCTTAGEIAPQGYADGSLTGVSIAAADCRAVATCLPDVSGFRMSSGDAAAETLVTALARPGERVDGSNTFALLLIDGLSRNEEAVVASVHWRLGTIPLCGGSAGDDLRLERTYVYCDGRFHGNAAVLALVTTPHPFRVFKSQHFSGSATRMVVTRADPARRVVMEINAEPAAREYARLVGLDPDARLTQEMFARHPVLVKLGGDHYVRSIQKVGEDGSLTFFCAIDEGVVLTLARHGDVLGDLEATFRALREEIGPPELVIGFDCVHRDLELQERQQRHLAGRLLAENNVVGFHTYGEQYSTMHVNETFTGVALGRARRT